MNWYYFKSKSVNSKPFEGYNIINTALNSIYGIFTNIINDINIKLDICDENKLSVPKIIVIGTESCGKSSLLENITKCELFPKNSKMCTMTPIHIILSKNNNTNYYIKYTLNNIKIEKKGNNMQDIYNIINEYFTALNNTYSEDEIQVSLEGSTLPNFEFYDLPGLVAYPHDKAIITQNIINKYLHQDNIILCVEDATKPRLTASQTIAMIQDKKLENRTILILTKIDKLCDIDIEECLIDRILNKSDEIKNINFADCLGVINRDHYNRKTLLENDKFSNEWINHNIINTLPEQYLHNKDIIINRLGINNLIIKINNFYNQYLNNIWKTKILLDLKTQLLNDEINIELLGISINITDIQNINIIIQNILNDIPNKNIYINIKNNENFFNRYITKDEDNTDTNINLIDTIFSICNNLNDLLQNQYKITLKEFNIQNRIINEINDIIYHDDIRYNLYRFNKLKNKLINFINKNIDNLLVINHNKIYKYIYDYLISYIYDSSKNDLYSKLLKKLHKMYYNLFMFFIIYPIFKDKKIIQDEFFNNIDINDFEENIDIINKKKLYQENINYLNLKIDEINCVFTSF